MIKSLLSFVLIVLLFLSSLGAVIFRLQDTDFVVGQARGINLYGRLTENVGGLLPSEATKAYGLGSADVTDVLRQSIDSEQFYGFLTAAGQAYLPWLAGKTDQLSFSYDLTTIKQKLTDQMATKIRANYDQLPLCNQSQLRQWSFDNTLPECRLPNGTLAAKSLNNQISVSAAKISGDLPDTLTAHNPPSSLQQLRLKLALTFRAIYLIWGASALVILLFLIIYRRHGLVSLAVAFLLVGLLQVAFSLIGWDWIARTIGDALSGSSEAKAIVPIGLDLISVIVGAMKTTFGNISVASLGLGVALLVFGLISRFHHAKPVEVKS